MTNSSLVILRDISTHSLTKRLTDIICYAVWNVHISTHSLTKRLTSNPPVRLLLRNHFNSQPHEEADTMVSGAIVPIRHFNSQPHEEADSNFRQKYIYLKLFFTLIAHTNLVFLFKLLYCKFFSGKIHTFSGANVLKYFCKLTFRTIILKYL